MAAQDATELFFSEYVEGSSFNKAVEIYNGTGQDVDLSAYGLELYSNGNTSVQSTLDLSGTLVAGDTYVIADSQAAQEILDVANTTSSVASYNGNDALLLLKGGQPIDALGQVGEDSYWGAEVTLRRKASVCAGDTNPDDAFDPIGEWNPLPQDTFGGLGGHTATCAGDGGGDGDPDPVAAALAINEVDYDQQGTDDAEFIEIKNTTNEAVDLLGYTVELVNGANSTVYGTFALPDTTLAAGGYYVLCTDTATVANCDEAPLNSIQNGNSAPDAIVLSFNGQVVDALTYEGDLGAPYTEGSGSGLADSGDAGEGLSRIPDGADTDQNNVDFQACGITPGAENDCGGGQEDPVAIGECSEPATLISKVQGDGASSPLVGDDVIVEGGVVGDFQGGAALGGFFVQEEDGDEDGDPATSEGVFVFDGDGTSSVEVSAGDTVRVAGTVEEFFDATQLGNVTDVVVCDPGASVNPTELELPLTGEELERVENMLVVFPQELVISEYFNFDQFGEIVLALPLDDLDRPFQPTSYAEPGSSEANDVAEAITERRITLDDGRDDQNPDFARHPNGDEFTLQNRFRGGDLVTDATGVLNYAFGLYRIQPTTGATYTSVNPRPAVPEVVGGELTVATLNVLNYFTSIDDGSDDCGPNFDQECRGADTVEELERQEAKIVAALAAMDADVVGLIEIQNNAGVVQTLVDALNDEVGGVTYEAIETGAIGPDAIKVAFLYKPETVTPLGEHAVLDTDAFLDPNGLGEAKNRPALAQSFVQDSDGAIFTAVVNHLKSKGSACGSGDDDPMQGNCNLTRTLAAQELMDWIATDPTGSRDADYLILGDLNAYDEEDPIDVLENGGYVDLGEEAQGEFAYTYVFDGQFGHLDYAMANASLAEQVTGATNWHVNADEPDILDYDMTFKQPRQQALYEANAYRSSDHDPVIVGLDLDDGPGCSAAEPSSSTLWPPNHKMVPIGIDGITDTEGDAITIEITSIFQDEPVELPGGGDGDTAPDAESVSGSTASVRAERDEDGNGRVYHIGFTATDEHAASCAGEVQVSVPSSRGRNGGAVDDGALHDSTQLQ